MVDVKCCLEACHSTSWYGCDLTTGWASQDHLSLLISDYHSSEAGLAVDMEALEQLWVSVGVQTNGAGGKLILYFLEYLLSHFRSTVRG